MNTRASYLEQHVVSAHLASHIIGAKPREEITAYIYLKRPGRLTIVQRPDQTIKCQDAKILFHDRKPNIVFGHTLHRVDREIQLHEDRIDFYDRPPDFLVGRLFHQPDASIKLTRG